MAVPFDNSKETNSSSILPRIGEGVVIDIGTGDGRFVSTAARNNPAKFYIGIDPNAKPLENPSMKATRKPAKGGLPNALFVQAAVEDLPDELDGTADEIHIHFPWGSLLRSVVVGDQNVLRSLRRICALECLVEIVFGIDEDRDSSEIERFGLPQLSSEYLKNILIPKYVAAGFAVLDSGILSSSEWPDLDTSWAKKLKGGQNAG